MDAVENGQAFTVTRDGHRIGELIPLRHRRRFVPRQEFAAMSRSAPGIDIDAFRNPDDFTGLENLLAVVPGTRPRLP
jgi:antitoxin (DNA-binding transcriptional repressor) of toxin-antitoxin stability system